MDLALLRKYLTQRIPILGYKTSVRMETVPDADFVLVHATNDHGEWVLSIPTEDSDGVMDIHGSSRVLVRVGVPDPTYNKNRNDLGCVYIKTKEEILSRVLLESFQESMMNGGDEYGQLHLDRWLASSPLMMVTQPDKPLDRDMLKDTVYFELPGSSILDRIPKNWAGTLDVLATPTSDRVGSVYRLSNLTDIKDGRLRPSGKLFCRTYQSCLLFPENNRPYRLICVRTGLARHEPLADFAEDPWVRHTSYVEGSLRGCHLETAIVAAKYTHADSIQISETAARKLECYHAKNQCVVELSRMMPMVEIGEVVQPHEVVAVVLGEDGTTKNITSNLQVPGEVVDVRLMDTRIGTTAGWKLRIRYRCRYPMHTGDKIVTRHGGKGVVFVVPDDLMPVVNDRRVEVCVHPRSVFARQAYGVFREMMLNRKLQSEGHDELAVKHFSDDWNMQDLVNQGYGKKHVSTLLGEDTGQELFSAPLYWLRTDKHVMDACAAVGDSDRRMNHMGRIVDRGKVGGARLTLGMNVVLQAKGLGKTADTLVQRNVPGSTLRRLKDVLQCLDNDQKFL